MTVIVKLTEADTRLSDLLAKVEAGEDVIISRGDTPVARLSPIQQRRPDLEALIAEVKATRRTIPPVTHEEILSWRDEGRR
jgi:prevent-host-death family protein